VLNRFSIQSEDLGGNYGSGSHVKSDGKTIHVMKYMFPRQFGLHNVFTSAVDSRETVQPFKDYTMREDEIMAKISKGLTGGKARCRVPKRLRNGASLLVRKLQIQQKRCAYKEMIEHYCPSSVSLSCRTSSI
jgi:telomerase reverse transcriptase